MIRSGSSFAMLAFLGALAIGGCSVSEEDSNGETALAEDPVAGGVTRKEAVAGVPPAQPMAPMTVIQSQPGPGGSQLDLLKVAVTGDILTVTLRCSSPEQFNGENFRISQISIIDDATSQRIGVLEDNEGKAMVSNFSTAGAGSDSPYIRTECETTPGVMWAKFPAPPATSKTISINFPEVAPFDGVTVQR